MCGIFGVAAKAGSQRSFDDMQSVVRELYELSESRGKESAGIAVRNSKTAEIVVLKSDVSASRFIKSPEYKNVLENVVRPAFTNTGASLQGDLSIIAHSRLVTNGSQLNNENNQPVIKNGGVIVHNGIVTNIDSLWTRHGKEVERQAEVDTEILVALIRHRIEAGQSPIEATRSVFAEIQGAASIAMMMSDRPLLLLASNTGSLYFSYSSDRELIVFASERFILQELIRRRELDKTAGMSEIQWNLPFSGKLVNLSDLTSVDFSLTGEAGAPAAIEAVPLKVPFQIRSLASKNQQRRPGLGFSVSPEVSTGSSNQSRLLEFNVEAIGRLKRCSKCVLPETFPFISFDQQGVCNFCRNHKPISKADRRGEFEQILNRYRKPKGQQDCIVAFSGGRDSSYGLHVLKKEFDLNPITFTYDWGMVTDLARRNIARITGQLGIENILVSADIQMKRSNIRKNILAWLKRPDLGMIPLFMAGDKHFFTWANRIKKQTGLKLDIWAGNRYENTDFKVGFCGIKPKFEKDRIDSLPLTAKMQMPLHYLKNFALSPGYINSSLIDTVSAYHAYYFEPRRDYYLLFDYLPWNEDVVNRTILEEYDWETSPDTTSTWRIGDGTAAFYNYVYHTVAGFTEVDTFRSNQIRDGVITREQALKQVMDENRPRYESIKWYTDVLDLPFDRVISVINAIPKLYSV